MPAKPFVLSVKAVLFNEHQHCLLLRRSAQNRSFVGCWEWPGGKVNAGEDFTSALLREVDEETGLKVEITSLAGATQFEMPKVNVLLLCMESRVIGGELRLSGEHDDAAWVPLGQFSNRTIAVEVREFMLDFASNKARKDLDARR